MAEKLLPKRVKLEYVLRKGDYHTSDTLVDKCGSMVLCISQFAELMNAKELPSRVRVIVSTRPIRDAAKVYVMSKRLTVLGIMSVWQDLNGNSQWLFSATDAVFGRLGATEEWLPIWIDFKEARKSTELSVVE